MSKKIRTSEFISDKKLEKIQKIIDKSANTDDAYDKIENLLIDDFKTYSLGTNRIIFIHKKHPKYVCKIAGDSHGIEANFREFYNGDLDEKRITKSYSISDNGVFLVQERVKVFDSKTMDKRKKEVRNMLKHLEPILLLVDCKLSNFKNFGIRKNGDIVLLDHGDTVPLTMYDNGNIVNIVEEGNVSLRCKEFKKGTLTSRNPKPCGGKLEYSKNYDYLVCKKCESKMPIHNAYKEFYGYAVKNNQEKRLVSLQDGFDPEEYAKKVQNSIRNYAKETMNNVKDKKENKDMYKKINGEKCQQIKGYWLPINSEKKFSAAKLMAVKKGEITPKQFLEFLGVDPDDYKMTIKDHKDSKIQKDSNTKYLSEIANKIVSLAKETEVKALFDKQDDERRNGVFRVVLINGLANEYKSKYDINRNVYYIHKALKSIDGIESVFFDEDAFYIRFEDDEDNEIPDSSSDEAENINDNDIEENIDIKNESAEIDTSTLNTRISFDDFDSMDIIKHKHLGTNCVKYNGYLVPITILSHYYNHLDAVFIIPNDPVIIFNRFGYNPDLYKIDADDVDDITEDNDNSTKKSSSSSSESTLIDSSLGLTVDDVKSRLTAFVKELLNRLDDTDNEKNYGTISYSDMKDLLIEYGLYNSNAWDDTNNQLTIQAIELIKSASDEILNIDNFDFEKLYAIEIKKYIPYHIKVNQLIDDHINNHDELISDISKLIDYDSIKDMYENTKNSDKRYEISSLINETVELINEIVELMSFIEISDGALNDNDTIILPHTIYYIFGDKVVNRKIDTDESAQLWINNLVLEIVLEYLGYLINNPTVMDNIFSMIDDEEEIDLPFIMDNIDDESDLKYYRDLIQVNKLDDEESSNNSSEHVDDAEDDEELQKDIDDIPEEKPVEQDDYNTATVGGDDEESDNMHDDSDLVTIEAVDGIKKPLSDTIDKFTDDSDTKTLNTILKTIVANSDSICFDINDIKDKVFKFKYETKNGEFLINIDIYKLILSKILNS